MTGPKPSLPRLSAAARQRVLLTIESERMCGSRQVASDLEVLLAVHDRAHGIEEGRG